MEKYELKADMNILCVAAKSFPEGVKEAFQSLEKIIPVAQGRPYFGISYLDESGSILYKAGMLEAFEGEGEQYDCETVTIQKGEYLMETLPNWRGNESIIGETFRKLGDSSPNTVTPGVEWYQKDGSVWCMLRILPSNA